MNRTAWIASLLASAVLSSGCLPGLDIPPPNTPPEIILQCGADASAHNIVLITGIVLAGLGTAGLIAAVEANNGHNAQTTNAIADTSAAAGAAGLGLGTVLAPLITANKYIHDGCVLVTGPLPYAMKPKREAP